jgi:hypothetical protein
MGDELRVGFHLTETKYLPSDFAQNTLNTPFKSAD